MKSIVIRITIKYAFECSPDISIYNKNFLNPYN